MSIIDHIKKAEQTSLSEDDLRLLTDGKVKVLAYHSLESVNDIDEVLGKDGASIILYQTKESYGHWVSLIKVNESTLEFFDSLGWKVDQELQFSDYNIRIHNGQAIPHLTNLIEQSNYKLIQNTTKLQKNSSDDNTCGRWAGLRVRLRDMPLKKFVALFTKTKEFEPDFWISALTVLFS